MIDPVLGAIFSVLLAEGVQGAKSLYQSHRAKNKLGDAIQRAEEEFLDAAKEQGLGDASTIVLQLKVKDKQTTNQIARAILSSQSHDELHSVVEHILSGVKSLRDQERLRAVALYAEKLHTALWNVDEFHDIVDKWQQQEQSQQLGEILSLLKQRLPLWDAWGVLYWPKKKQSTGLINLRSLRAQKRLIPFSSQSRKKRLKELVEWAEGLPANGMVGIRLYVGKGGSGKTRLAIEAGDQLRDKGWRAWFVDTADRVEDFWAKAWIEEPESSFLVVDYAGSKTAIVKRILSAAARFGSKRTKPLAIVLLDREHSGELKSLMEDRTAYHGEAMANFSALDVAETKRLPPLSHDERHELFAEAKQKFAELSGSPQGEVDYAPDELPERPLAVILLALLAANGHRVAQSGDELRVFEDVWFKWERMKWKHTLESNKIDIRPSEKALDLIEAAAVAASLGRPFRSADEVAEFWNAHYNTEARASRELASILPTVFSTAPHSPVDPIVPDPLADWVIYRFCIGHESIMDWLDSVFSSGESKAKAALVFHRLLASSTARPVEDEAMLIELCKWADRQLKPTEIAPIFDVFERLWEDNHKPDHARDKIVKSYLALKDSVPTEVFEFALERGTINRDIMNVIQPKGARR